jgi:hypothetical protein
MGNESLRRNVAQILDARIKRLSRESYVQANTLANGRARRRHVPYAIPAVAQQCVKLLSRVWDPAATADEIEGIASWATTGEAQHAFAAAA